MTNAIKLILSCFISLSVYSQDTARILLNKAPVLKASEEVNKNAVENTKLLIKDINHATTLGDRLLFVGARLWNKLETDPYFRKIKYGNITYRVPKFNESGGWSSKEEVKGKVLQDPEHFLKFWTYIKENFSLDSAQISELTTRDKFIYWYYYAKIEEPIVAIQSSKARLILSYVNGKLFFVELTSE